MIKKIIYKITNAIRYRFQKFIIRPFNQIHRFDFPSENNGWKKIGNSPVWGSPKTGTMFDPYVYLDHDIFHMVVSNRDHKSLAILNSVDGIHWDGYKDILKGRDSLWDNDVNRGCLVFHEGKYYLWYTGQNKGVSSIGLAISDNGQDFVHAVDTPVLKATTKAEGVSVMNPCVLWDENIGKFRMWYSAGENYEPDVICYAESTDGIKWNKLNEPVLSKFESHIWERYKIGGCNVLRNDDGSYDIYYIGYQNLDVARICKAHSKDGIHWTREENNLLLSPTKNAWDSDAVYKPSVVKKNGKEYLWYNGRKDCHEFIGLAIREQGV